MHLRLLIINCPSPFFVYVPMGTFGLCDYLNQRSLPCKILNLSLYERSRVPTILDQYLQEYHPTHVALIFHWQETAEGVFWIGERVKSQRDQTKTICGGFTAGYFGEDLLRRCWFVDYVIQGDPERPMELLLGGAPAHEIPNLVYRDGAGIRVNDTSYNIDNKTISGVSFSDLSYLFDYELYIKAVEEKLGFPLFIGRGCVFSCDYCGGSRESFRLHSRRNKPVTRTIPSIIADLTRLKQFTDRLYICYEIDLSYVKALFEAIKSETTLVKAFKLNYGTWELFDRHFLELYRDLFIIEEQDKPLFEISPEVFDEESRRKLKHRKTYSIEQMLQNLSLIKRCLNGHVKVYIYFSRYHETASTYAAVREETFRIFRLKHDLLTRKYTNVKVYYDHLSTDVGSIYWDNYVENPRDLDTLLSWTKKLKNREEGSFPVDNLCIYRPKGLSERDVYKCEVLISLLKSVETHAHELFHIMFQCLDELVIPLLEEVMARVYLDESWSLFEPLDPSQLLCHIERTITQNQSMLSRIPFVEDLVNLQIKKAVCQSMPRQETRQDRKSYYRLNHSFVSVHNHDYLDLARFLDRLQKEGAHNLMAEQTVVVFLMHEVVSMSYDTYCMTLKLFKKGLALSRYYALMHQKGIFNPSYHESFLGKMFGSGVLVEFHP
jgi:hypothetical protein